MRGLAYDRGWLPATEIGHPVLSIGNITAGGTGKTPLTSMLVTAFGERGRRVGVVSRGYGGVERGPARVAADGGRETAVRFGDEPAWLAARHPGVSVVVGADRVAAARELLRVNSGVDLILADDAFQHRRLARGFDVVVVDATEPVWHYRPLPLGRLREGLGALARARAIFLTKTNLASHEELTWVRALLRKSAPEVPVFEFESRIQGVVSLGSPAAMPAERVGLTGSAVFLTCGIGRPRTFHRLVDTDLGARVAGHWAFPDHHRYSADDWLEIVARATACAAQAIVVTEKDAIKLAGLAGARPPVPVWVTRLETRPKSALKEFYDEVDRFLI